MTFLSIVAFIIFTVFLIKLWGRLSDLEEKNTSLENKISKLINYFKEKDLNLDTLFKEDNPSFTQAPSHKEPAQSAPDIIASAAEQEETPQTQFQKYLQEQKAKALKESAGLNAAQPVSIIEQSAVASKEDASPVPPVPAEEPVLERQGEAFDIFGKLTAAKIFSWVGGFALLLGVIFVFKYYTEYITPQMRIIAGAVLGIALIIAGFIIKAPKLKITSNTLSGSGLAILYGSIYAGFAFYALIPISAAFVLMAAVALGSMLVSVLKEEKYIGFLGVLIGFLTPILLSTGQDRYMFFFSYIAFINVAAIAAALRKEWDSLLIFTFALTWLAQLLWIAKGLPVYKANAFGTLFVLYVGGAAAIALYKKGLSDAVKYVLAGFICANILLALPFLLDNGKDFYPSVKVFMFVFVSNIMLALMYYKDKAYNITFNIGRWIVFAILLFWTANHFNQSLLALTCGLYALAAVINSLTDFLAKGTGEEDGSSVMSSAYLVFLMLPLMMTFDKLSIGGVAALNGLYLVLISGSIFLSARSKTLWPAFVGGGFVILSLLVFILGGRPFYSDANISLIMLMGILPAAVMPCITYVVNKKGGNLSQGQVSGLSFYASLMPYLLLVTLFTKGWQHSVNSMCLIFAFILGLNLITALFSFLFKKGAPLLISLTGTFFAVLVYYVLHLFRGLPSELAAYNYWIGGLFAFFILVPLLLKQRFMEDKEAWIAAAVAGMPVFVLLYITLKTGFTFADKGLLPLGLAIVYLVVCLYVYGWQKIEDGIQRARLAMLGAAALFFITAIFPLQFSKQWLTIAFALEGAALVWLTRSIAHKGLKYAALGLLGTVFIRLVCNPMIALYYETGSKIFNWYLYTYGISALAMLGAAAVWKKESDNENGFIVFLNAIGVITLFALLNIEIADYFTPSGLLRFEIFGSLAATVTYTLAWALFGSACFAVALLKRSKAMGFAGLALISVSTIKLFIVDIWSLGPLYRIFGLFGIAVILIIVSFALQKFKERVDGSTPREEKF